MPDATDTTSRTPPAASPALSEREIASLSELLTLPQELVLADDLESGLAAIGGALRRHLEFDTLGILLLDERGRELSFAYADGYPARVAEHWRFGLGQGLVGTAASERRILRVDDVESEPRYINACESTRSELLVPLVARNRTIGVLLAGSSRPRHFTNAHERLAAVLAPALAAAIEHQRLQRSLREQARTLSLLHELSREFTSILERGRLIERIARRLAHHIEFDLFGLMRWNADEQRLDPWFGVYRDGRPHLDGRSLELGEGICGTAAALRQPVRVPNVQVDPRYVRCIHDLEVASELAVPLLVEDRLIGVLVLDSTRFDAFGPRHEQLLSTLASSIAIALENARLYESVQANQERMQRDLSTAREIQKRLLPSATPWVVGTQLAVAYEPARDLAGDFYDFLPYGEGRIAIAVGDVAGKSTPAALYGTLAVGMLREYAVNNRYEPARVLADMNGKLRQLSIPNRFLALTFAVYDPSARRLTLAGSGLPYPLLARDGKVEAIEVRGVPLGLLPAPEYRQTQVDLEPGDVVVLVSDGVEEARDPLDRELGSEAVAEVVRRHANQPADAIANALVEAARRHAAPAEPQDDRTVLVLRITEDPRVEAHPEIDLESRSGTGRSGPPAG